MTSTWIVRASIFGWFSAGIAVTAAQTAHQPPDFSRIQLRDACERVGNAWLAWEQAASKLESEIGGLPMGEAERRTRQTAATAAAYVESRRAYSEAVASLIENASASSSSSRLDVPEALVSGDQLDLLGAALSRIQAALDDLRASPNWTKIRRSVQADRAVILSHQEYLRAKMPVQAVFERNNAATSYSALDYRESERRVRELLAGLWTHYYDALAASVALPVGTRTTSAADDLDSHVGRRARDRSPFVGTWTYAPGSQQFNGVAEPKQVVLELWMSEGQLIGRYRAQLTDFDGIKPIDLQLRGTLTTGHEQLLEFRTDQPEATGKISLREARQEGNELLLTRLVESGGPVPRGREVLTRTH